MDKDKSEVFKSFTNKAIKRFQEKKVRKYRTLHIPSLDENIKIRNLDYPEIVECTESKMRMIRTRQINIRFIWPLWNRT